MKEMDSTGPNSGDAITLNVKHNNQQHTFTFPATSTVSDLSTHITTTLSIPPSNQKFLCSPKPGLLKPPFDTSSPNGSIPLSTLQAHKITLLGSTPAEISSLDSAIAASQKAINRRPGQGGPIRAATPARTRDWKTLQDAATYTFMDIKPLPYLPNPERSLRFLQRLADDPGIKSVMAAHKFSVGLLTEMNPAEHTTHESRTLGLNRNAGQIIELRLRTDAYDGYRDYKTIRKTLCHELTHNVHGEHDRKFWDLCGKIEKEVDRADWKSGGRTVGEDEFYNPNDGGMGDIVDHGVWSGEAHVLGGAGEGVGGAAASEAVADRRAVMAKAAEERARRQQQQDGASREP